MRSRSSAVTPEPGRQRAQRAESSVREQLSHARVVPAEALIIGRQRDDDRGDGAERVVEPAHQRLDRQARVDRLASVMFGERSERVIPNLRCRR